MQYVCALGNEEMVSFLLKRNADSYIKDKTGRNALEIAQHLKREKVIEILLEFSDKKHFQVMLSKKMICDFNFIFQD